MANFIVTNTNDDSLPGSLRKAIIDANNNPGADTISFGGQVFADATPDTITLLQGALNVTDEVTITGTGADKLAISGNNTYGIFYATAPLTIDGLTITKGNDYAGAIYSAISLSVNNSTISGNEAYQGGGIYSDGSVTVTNSTISDNEADQGGGIYSDGSVTVTNSTISDNTSYNRGAGIYSDSSLTVSNSTISGNHAFSDGAGIYSKGSLTVSNSTISDNVASYSGGIYSEGSLTVSNSIISGNTADYFGGGIYSLGQAVVNNSTIFDNHNTSYDGGGIYSEGSLKVSNSTISGNQAFIVGGGISNKGSLTVSNSTISGNNADFGGGIYNSGDATVSNSTIYHNTTFEGLGGGIYNDYGATVQISNSIIAGNGGEGRSDIYGDNLNGDAYNLIGSIIGSLEGNYSGTLGTGTDIINPNPGLEPLANNGGSTLTHALKPDSPALNAGNPNYTGDLTTDQRGTGFNRIKGGRLDIGAFESGPKKTSPKISFDTVDYYTTEGYYQITIAITLDATPDTDVTFSLGLDNSSTAVYGEDYQFLYGLTDVFYFTAGATGENLTQFVDVVINDDYLPENAETVILNFGSLEGADVGEFGETTINIFANDAIEYEIYTTTPTLTEGNIDSQPVTFTIIRSGGIGVASTVNYALSGTATLGSDYNIQGETPLSGTLSFIAGETTKTITVNVLGDKTVEPNENMIVTLSNPNLTTAPESSTIYTSSAKVDIINDDQGDVPTSVPTLIDEILFDAPGTDTPKEYIELRGTPGATIAAGTYLVGIEGDSGSSNPGNVQDIFDLSGKQFGSNGLLVLLQKGSTYVPSPGANVITNTGTGAGWGNGALSSIGRTGTRTEIENGSVSFFLIEAPTAPTLTNDIDSNNDGTADGAVYESWKVLDSVSVLDGTKADKAYGSIVFKRGSGGSAPANATVVKTSFIAGYVGRSGDTTGSAASDWVASLITGTGANLTLGTATKTSPGEFAGQPLNHIGSSNFIPPADVNYEISTSTASVTEGSSGKQAVSFTVTRSGNTALATTVNYILDGTATFGKDYNNVKVAGLTGRSSGIVKFAAGETTKTISLNVVGDKLSEADETINLTLKAVNKTDALASGTLTIVDNDIPTISIADKSVNEETGNIVFTVKLSTTSAKTITVDYNTANDSALADADYTATTGSLTFNPGVTTQTITVPILNDFLIEESEKFFVNLLNPTNATIVDNKAIATITDTDKPGFAISPANALITTEAGGTANFNIQLATQPTADVTFNLISSNPKEGTISVESVTFTTANWNTPQTITVTGVDDGIADDNTAYQIITSKAVSTDTKYNNLNSIDVGVINIKSGNQINSIITGTALADTSLEGTTSDDLIFGFAGNDVIVGGEGSDRIYGGLGTDTLTGGAGNDIFVLAKGEGKDTIKDFNVSEDFIALSGGLLYSGLSITQTGNDTLIKVTANNQSLALLTGVGASTLSAGNFITDIVPN